MEELMGGSLRIDKLILLGRQYKRTLVFGRTLNIIKGDGYSGKSLVLKLISYCLGNDKAIDLSVQKELAEYCDEVFVEISIENKIYTFNRHLKIKQNEVKIYLCSFEFYKEYSPWKKNTDEAIEFIAQELGIKMHQILKKKPGSKDLTSEDITFRDFMRFIFIRQGQLSTNNFLENKNPFVIRKNKEVFKIINDLVVPDIEEVENQIRLKQNEYNKIEKITEGLESYLNNRNALDLLALQAEKENIDNEINKVLNAKKALINSKTPGEDDLYRNFKDDTLKMNKEIDKLLEYRRDIILSIKNKELLLQDYNIELDKIFATLEAMKKIKINEHASKCPLCNSLLHLDEEVDYNLEDIEFAYEQLKKKINELKKILDEEGFKLNEINEQISKSKLKKEIYLEAIKEYRANTEIPNLAELEALNTLIRNLQKEKNKINSLFGMHSEIETNMNTLARLKKELEKLEKKKKKLNELSVDEEQLISDLSERYRTTLKKFKFDNDNESETYISEKDYLPYYSGSSVSNHTSGCLLLCMQIAYLGAILDNGHNNEQHFYHPRLLMLDTVSNNIGTNKDSADSLDPETYEEIYKYLIHLSESNQVFIIDNTPPEIKVAHTSYTFYREGLKGLINLEKNEFNKSNEVP